MRRLLLCVVVWAGLGLVAGCCCGGSNLCDWGGFPCGNSAPASYSQ
ncbi:MAG: hypothetical protein JW809_05880 [Pirellulales bacterium]|nr:hypothetical protein [Pirellulales bacterium]